MQKKNTGSNHDIIHALASELKLLGFGVIVGVPCSILEGFISHPTIVKYFRYICATNEGEAVAIATGANLSGKKAIVFCQNSGLGNMVNPITSLTNTFKIPILYLVSWRGIKGKSDAPQHEIMGQITLKLLLLLQMKCINFPKQMEDVADVIENISNNYKNKISTCLIVDEKIQAQEQIQQEPNIRKYADGLFIRNGVSSIRAKRIDILNKITNYFPEHYIYVSTTGDTSRDLFKIGDKNNNFYMVGSMGYASALGLGISLFTEDKVVILDGDGALLMHMGNMSTIGAYGNKNLLHIVLNNNVCSTTGGQYNSSINTDLVNIAKSCNYENAIESSSDGLEKSLEMLKNARGPSFLEIKIDQSGKTSSERPTITPAENALRIIKLLKKNYARSF